MRKKSEAVIWQLWGKHISARLGALVFLWRKPKLPNETKKDFCCLIISGFGAGSQAGIILRDHLRDSGMDAFLTTPSGQQTPRISREHWVHGVRMEYLALCKQYRRITLVGLSLGGMLMIHLLDLKPAALIFVNAPCAQPHSGKQLARIFQADLHSRMHGPLRAPRGRRELRQLAEETSERGMKDMRCPALVLQTLDDRVCDSSNADELYKQIQVADKSIRFYPEGGHDVLTSRTVLAVCSDIFQFCSRVRAGEEKQASS